MTETGLNDHGTPATPVGRGLLLRGAHRAKRAVADPAATLVGVALLLLFLIPGRYSVGPAGVRASVTIIIGLAAFGLWLAGSLFAKNTHTTGLNPFKWLLALLFVWTLYGIASAFRRPLTDIEANGVNRTLVESLALIGLALLLIDGIRSIEGLRRFVVLLLFGGYFSAAVGVSQRIFKYDYTGIWQHIPLLNSTLDAEDINGLLSNRATGTGTHPIEFSVACACLVPLALAHLRSVTDRNALLGHRIGIGLLLIGCLLGVSRAGFIGIVIAVIFSLSMLEGRQILNALAFGLVMLIIVQFGAHGTLTTLRYQLDNVGQDNSSKGRTADYGPVFDIVRQHLWTGIGNGTYQPDQNRFLDNSWLGTLISSGVTGVAWLALIILAGLYFAAGLRRRATSTYLSGVAQAFGIALLALAVCAYLFDEFSFHQTESLFFVCFGALGAVYTLDVRLSRPVAVVVESRVATPL